MVASVTTYRIVSDHLGSVRLVVDANTGVVAQRLDYDEFGNVTLDTSPGFRTDLGFLSRNYRPDTAGYHANLSYSFWPESSELIRWSPRIAMIHNEDQNGLRIFSQWSPRVQWEWDGDTELEIEYSTQKERLRPQDFAGLPFNRDYESEVLTASFETQSSRRIGYGIEFEAGTAINLDPADGMFPEIADYRAAELELLWRPIDRLRVTDEIREAL